MFMDPLTFPALLTLLLVAGVLTTKPPPAPKSVARNRQ
jgi:hypothetical protein